MIEKRSSESKVLLKKKYSFNLQEQGKKNQRKSITGEAQFYSKLIYLIVDYILQNRTMSLNLSCMYICYWGHINKHYDITNVHF